MFHVLFSSPELRARYINRPEDAPIRGHWAGAEEASALRTFATFADASDFAVKLCQDFGESCALVIADHATEELPQAWVWEAPFSSHMDAARCVPDVQAWSWKGHLSPRDGSGHATIIGPYPVRLDAFPLSKARTIGAAFINARAEVLALSPNRHEVR